MSDSWPDPETITPIYFRLLTGDPLARSDFIASVLDHLVDHLRLWRQDADEHSCISAAEDAVLSLIRNPSIYDPAKRSLFGYLRMAAQCDLLNEYQREKKHRRNREDRDCVELPDDTGNSYEAALADGLPSFEDSEIAAGIASFTPLEMIVFELMRYGEKRTQAFAAALGIEHLSAGDRKREVKRVKDRIIKRLQRAGGKT